MLSDEEITKEVNDFNKITVMYGKAVFLKIELERYQRAIKGLLDLYKQEKKEYEQYRKFVGIVRDEIDKDWRNKIKAKIEEYDDKGMTVNLASRSAGKTFQQAVRNEVREVLQSLLERE